jgi:hypothetical protein
MEDMMTMLATPRTAKTTGTRTAKFLIGAGAGFSLALVKLVEVNFYIGQASAIVLGGALTMVAFAVLAALFTMFAEDAEPGKLFMQGLLAPSLLVAVVHRGADAANAMAADVTVPTLSITELLMPTVHAQAPAAAQPAVKTLKPGQFEGTLADGALMVLGRAQQQESFVYVVGKTTDRQQATSAAAKLRRMTQQAGLQVPITVVQAEGSSDLFVTVGSFQSAADAAKTKTQVVDKVLNAPQTDQSALKALLNGPIVDGRTLAKKR